MNIADITGMAHHFAAQRLEPGDCAIDATAGNGKDLLFLAETVGPGGKVYGFDIQPDALSRSREVLKAAKLAGRVVLLEYSHANMAAHIPPAHRERINIILFNLGYLPGGDPSLTTRSKTTLTALDSAYTLLAPGGLLCVVVYPGHPEGKQESAAVRKWSASRPAAKQVCAEYRLTNRMDSPWILLVNKHTRDS